MNLREDRTYRITLQSVKPGRETRDFYVDGVTAENFEVAMREVMGRDDDGSYYPDFLDSLNERGLTGLRYIKPVPVMSIGDTAYDVQGWYQRRPGGLFEGKVLRKYNKEWDARLRKKRQKKEEDKTPNVTWRNPVAVGAGQHFFIQVLPKSRMSFTAKQKKMAKSKRAKTPMVGTAGRDSTGFHDIFGGLEKAGYIAWKGTDKKTGKAAPWMIQLPKKRGKRGSIAFKAKRVTKDGKSYKTIRPFTKDRQVLKAWDKFTKLYGEPIFAENKNKPNLFRIARKGRGTFYNRK